jgi:hypothetical protein
MCVVVEKAYDIEQRMRDLTLSKKRRCLYLTRVEKKRKKSTSFAPLLACEITVTVILTHVIWYMMDWGGVRLSRGRVYAYYVDRPRDKPALGKKTNPSDLCPIHTYMVHHDQYAGGHYKIRGGGGIRTIDVHAMHAPENFHSCVCVQRCLQCLLGLGTHTCGPVAQAARADDDKLRASAGST